MSIPLTHLSVKVVPVFSKRVGAHGQGVVVRALLTLGTCTVPTILRGMGLSEQSEYRRNNQKKSSSPESREFPTPLFTPINQTAVGNRNQHVSAGPIQQAFLLSACGCL